jgi:hypothetical protein
MAGAVRRGVIAAGAMLVAGAAIAATTSSLPALTRGGDVRAAALPSAHAVSLSAAEKRRFPTAASIHRAIAYLKGRDCEAALAVVDTQGKLYGYRSGVTFTSASVVKAMLLVQYLRTHPHLESGMRTTLTQMITESDNDAAYRTYAAVGARGLLRLARRSGMRRFSPGDDVLYSRITAADQARFFARLDDYLPAAQRRFARSLLTHIVSRQTWGIAEVARPRWRVLFKSGWFGAADDPYTLVNQVARLERGDAVWSVAVLSDGNPHSPYAFATLRGVTRRLLGSVR